MPDGTLTHLTADVVFRPPRVAVLFDGGAAWRGWARVALTRVSTLWGGGGFLLVPFDEAGDVHPRVLDGVKAYDPDVVTYMTHPTDGWRLIDPAQAAEIDAFTGAESEPLVGAHRARAAAERVAASLTLLSGTGRRRPRPLSLGSVGRPPSFLIEVEPPERTSVAASPTWPSDLALAALARTGGPTVEDVVPTRPDDAALIDWLLQATVAPDEMIWPRESTPRLLSRLRPWFAETDQELAAFSSGFPEIGGALVVGGTASDFGLAQAYEQLHGFGLWLTLESDELLDTPLTSVFFEELIQRASDNGQRLIITSTSLSEEDLSQWWEKRKQRFSVRDDDDADVQRECVDVGVHGLRPSSKHQRLGIRQGLGSSITFPVFRADDGTAMFAAPFDAGHPAHAESLVTDSGLPGWIVTVSAHDVVMPSGRGLPGRELLSEDGAPFPVSIRSSRDGVSFHAASYGLVTSTMFMPSRLAHPRLRIPGLYRWVQSVAKAGGLDARFSRPGQHAQLLAKRLGGRAELRRLATGALRPLLAEFVRADRSERSEKRFPDGDGVMLGSAPYLSFAAAERLVESEPDSIRSALDDLLRVGVLRRGLILNCTECGEASFIALGFLRQEFECPRCSAMNALVSARWRAPLSEPTWFYDLHHTFRELLNDHGDVVLRSGSRLESASRRYADTAEIEFRDQAGKRLFELDLIALADERLIVVESKQTPRLKGQVRTRMIRKRFEAATLLQADAVAFSTAGSWSETLKTSVASIAADYPSIETLFLEEV